ncbi:phage portal protein [Olsenella phocaeensis]|uniref:phage portal protein n=1 Tax=Olsenella phocaeensis TaxID=1852385 RepID=UPI000931A495|nr:phage portal protein [Olsenella phocaeensis]
MANALMRLFRRGPRWERVAGPRATAVLGKTPGQVYREQPALRAVVGFLARNVAATPIKVYERRGDNDRPRDVASQLALLLTRPNASVTTYELVRATVSDILIYGWALWYVVPNADMESGWEATRVPPEWVTQPYTKDGFEPSSWLLQVPQAGRAPVRIQAADCVRFALYDPSDPINPASPVEALKLVLAEQISAYDYRNKVWRNGGLVNRWISRDREASWSPGARERFAKDWKERFSGADGTDTGGTPLLEDGMQLHDAQLNARDAEWAQATTLAREDVAAVYGVNPSMVWHNDTQTYASARDNARALYAETLTPYFDLIQERVNHQLMDLLGMDATRHYAEFDLQSKLQASPEDLLPTLVSATGRPVLLTDEARAILNRPALGGAAAELATPLNLLLGDEMAQATDAGAPGEASRAAPAKSKGWSAKSHQRADAAGAALLTSTLTRFWDRQSKKVLPAIDSAKSRGRLAKADGDPGWWDAERWDRELSADLRPIMLELTRRSGRATLRDVGMDPDGYDSDRTVSYLKAMCDGRAKALNASMLRQLLASLDVDPEEADEDVAKDSPRGVYDKAKSSGAARAGLTLATTAAVWGCKEAIGQRVPASEFERRKTWVHAGSGEANPRDEHLAMDGETVGYDEPFSNGAHWPHDDSLTAEDTYGCQCEVEISIYRR